CVSLIQFTVGVCLYLSLRALCLPLSCSPSLPLLTILTIIHKSQRLSHRITIIQPLYFNSSPSLTRLSLAPSVCYPHYLFVYLSFWNGTQFCLIVLPPLSFTGAYLNPERTCYSLPVPISLVLFQSHSNE